MAAATPATELPLRRSRGRALARGAGWAVAVPAWLWALGTNWYFTPLPEWARMGLVGIAVLIPLAAVLVLRRAMAWCVGALAVWLTALVYWPTVQPRTEGDWSPDQARMPVVRIEGEAVTIENVRFATYRTPDDFEVAWETRSYRLDQLRTVDFMVEPFAAWRGPAHTLLTFGFAGGEHVAISVEIRKERGERFHPLAGIYKQFELMYVVGDERDLIGLRANVRRHDVYLLPVRATPAQVRALFVSMLHRADGLRTRPEFYHTVTGNCTTNIVRHVNELRDRPLGWTWRMLLPAHADDYAIELGLVDATGTPDEIRRRFRINARSAFGADGRAWSAQIRRAE